MDPFFDLCTNVCSRTSFLFSPLSVRLFFAFAPFKEELRELREQPIDPQAEQEIIDSIEEVYFSNDSFDMVQHELEVRHSLYHGFIDCMSNRLLNYDNKLALKFPRPLYKLISAVNPPNFS